MQPTREQKLERYKKLPENLKETIMSVDTSERFYAIGQKHQLNIEQVEILSKQAGLVLLGFEHPSKFIGNLARTLGVPEEKARMIAEDINVEIFRPVRESLKKIHGIIGEENLEKVTPSPAPVAPLPIRADSNRGSTILQDKIGTKPTIPRQNPPPNLPTVPTPPAIPKPPIQPILPPPKQEIAAPVFPQLRVGETGSSDENEDNLSREEILAGIENPVKASPTPITNNIVQNKLDGLVRMPKSEQEIKALSIDPYREPI